MITPLAPLAGPGTPFVSPLALLELGAALGRSHDHARHLLGDALELAFRLPRLWASAQEGRVPVWLVRQISRETHDLSFDAAAEADRLITAVPDKVASVAARRLIHEARLNADPDRAIAHEEEAAARRGVWLRRDGRAPGVIDVNMTLDADDADLLDATAVGILADPQHALDLMSGRTTDTRPGRGADGGGGDVDLVVHLTDDDLTSEHATAVEETRGAVFATRLAAWIRRRVSEGGRVRVRAVLDSRSTGRGSRDGCFATSSTTEERTSTTDASDLVRTWLTRHGIDAPVVTLHPIDLAADTSVDAHDPTPLMREQVMLRDAHCVFPGCRRDSRRCDLDHREPYVSLDDGGPPGQTRPTNLAPLCRRHHNAKTHHDWHYQRHPHGAYTWTSPTDHTYDVAPHTRAPLSH